MGHVFFCPWGTGSSAHGACVLLPMRHVFFWPWSTCSSAHGARVLLPMEHGFFCPWGTGSSAHGARVLLPMGHGRASRPGHGSREMDHSVSGACAPACPARRWIPARSDAQTSPADMNPSSFRCSQQLAQTWQHRCWSA
eukprot:gene1507-biopygen4804